MLSMDMAVTAMPYRPASWEADRMARQTKITGQAVERIDTPRPAMMFVPWPVVEAWAICCTSAYCGPVQYSVIHTGGAVNTSPVAQAPNSRNWLPVAVMALSGMIQSVTKKNAINDKTPAIARPL